MCGETMSAPSAQLGDLRKDEPRTAVAMWKRRVGKSPDNVAFRHYVEGAWRATTFRQADTAAREIAAGFIALGLLPGDRVCLLAQTRLEWVLCDLGILLAGGVTVPIYASNTAEQCEFIIRDAGAKILICEDDAQRDKLLPLRDRLFTVTGAVQLVGGGPGAGDFTRSLSALRASGREWLAAPGHDLDAHAETVGPEAICSTGRAMHVSDDDEQYLFLPLAHILGRELEWAGIETGYVTVFSRGTASIKDDLVATHPTFMAGVPRIFEKFYSGVQGALAQGSGLKRRLAAWAIATGGAHAAAIRAGKVGAGSGGGGLRYWLADKLVLSKLRARLGLDRCRFLISGGAPLASEIAEFFHGTGLLVLEGYGLTETTSAAFLNRLDKFRFGTVGPTLDVVETKIADDGEILMRGPSVFRQYYNNAAATAESVEPDGWFHSGDIGVIEDGFLRITDRKKDLIVTANGKKVAPQPIESALKATSSLVSQALVYGDKRPYCVALLTFSEEAAKRFGGKIGPALAEAPEVKAALQKDIDTVNAKLASFESIKRFAILPQDLTEASGELTPKLSVKRKVVIDKYRTVLEGLYKPGGTPAGD